MLLIGIGGWGCEFGSDIKRFAHNKTPQTTVSYNVNRRMAGVVRISGMLDVHWSDAQETTGMCLWCLLSYI